MRLYNDKWLKIINNDKYESIRKKIQGSFKDLKFFEEEHRYFVGDRELMCVSNVAGLFVEEEDWDAIAEATSKRHYDREGSKYYRMTKEDILDAWAKNSEHACVHGTERHNFGESCLHFMIGDYDGILDDFKNRLKKDEEGRDYFESMYPKEDAVVKFWNDIPYSMVPILAENKVYVINDDYAYSGTFDILFYYDAELNNRPAEESGLVIYDYKTNVDLYKNFAEKKMKGAFGDMLDMPLSHYKLQLSLYQLALETINLKVRGRRLIWLRPNGEYKKIPLESYSKVLHEELKRMKIN